jgi:hypothetical protein
MPEVFLVRSGDGMDGNEYETVAIFSTLRAAIAFMETYPEAGRYNLSIQCWTLDNKENDYIDVQV